MTATKVQATTVLGIGEYRDFPVAGTNLTVSVTRTADVAYEVFVVATTNGISTRVEGHTRDFSAVEHGADYLAAADAYRQELLNELAPAPAAELISATTEYLALAAEADALSPAARRAVLANVDGHIARGNGVSVSTLYSLAGQPLGDLTYTAGRRKQVTGLDLNGRGMEISRYLLDNRNHAHAA